MRKVKILGAAFIAVLAFAAISAASASASPLWLKNGNSITQQELAETLGKWTLTGHGIFGAGELQVECMGKLVGWVGPGSEDLVTEATDLSGNKVINCTVIKEEIAKCLTKLALVVAVNLPWRTELLEPKLKEVIDDFTSEPNGKLPAFNVSCELSSGKFTEETCEGKVKTDLLVNLASGEVEGKVLKVKSEKCATGTNSAEVSAEGTIKLALSTEPLTAHESP